MFQLGDQRFRSIWLRFGGQKCSQTERKRGVPSWNLVKYDTFRVFVDFSCFWGFLGRPGREGGPPGGPRGAQEAPKGGPRKGKIEPRSAPGGRRSGPRAPQEAAGAAQEPPKSCQERPKRVNRGFGAILKLKTDQI